MQISVVICSYLRWASLAECLRALELQTRLADEILVVLRTDDVESQRIVREAAIGATIICVAVEGVLAAINLALEHFRGDIVAFTDDDAKPQPLWLETIERIYLRSERIGAVGGRDRIVIEGRPDLLHAVTSNRVGAITRTGAVTGSHHCETRCREAKVDFLKGVNLSFRRKAINGIQIDGNLRGKGAQPAWEMDLCLKVKAKGHEIVFSQEAIVDHYCAPRLEDDERNDLMTQGGAATAFNTSYVVFRHASRLQRIGYLLRALLLGTGNFPGLAAAIFYTAHGDGSAFRRMVRVQRITLDAWDVAKIARLKAP